jgi:hypothetical protein
MARMVPPAGRTVTVIRISCCLDVETLRQRDINKITRDDACSRDLQQGGARLPSTLLQYLHMSSETGSSS